MSKEKVESAIQSIHLDKHISTKIFHNFMDLAYKQVPLEAIEQSLQLFDERLYSKKDITKILLDECKKFTKKNICVKSFFEIIQLKGKIEFHSRFFKSNMESPQRTHIDIINQLIFKSTPQLESDEDLFLKKVQENAK